MKNRRRSAKVRNAWYGRPADVRGCQAGRRCHGSGRGLPFGRILRYTGLIPHRWMMSLIVKDGA